MYIKAKASFLILILAGILSGCGKSDLDKEKERIQREAAALKNKIDSAQTKVDSAKKELDSLMYRIRKDSVSIDSMMKKINPLKKLN